MSRQEAVGTKRVWFERENGRELMACRQPRPPESNAYSILHEWAFPRRTRDISPEFGPWPLGR